jgi:hypothetical protein
MKYKVEGEKKQCKETFFKRMEESMKKSEEILSFLDLMQSLLSNQQIPTRNTSQSLIETFEIGNKERHQNITELFEEQQKTMKEYIVYTTRESQGDLKRLEEMLTNSHGIKRNIRIQI